MYRLSILVHWVQSLSGIRILVDSGLWPQSTKKSMIVYYLMIDEFPPIFAHL